MSLQCVAVNGSSSDVLQRQKRNWIIDSFRIDEGYDGPFPYSLGTVSIYNTYGNSTADKMRLDNCNFAAVVDFPQIQVEKTLTLFEIHGQGVDKDPKGVLEINDRTGEIFVQGPVDYEKYNGLKVSDSERERHGCRFPCFTITAFVLQLVFLALDRDSRVIDTRLGIDITVLDANDHPPVFDYPVYEVTIKESTMQGTL